MITPRQEKQLIRKSVGYLRKAGIVITPKESRAIEVADFSLSDVENSGLQLIVYLNTDRCCAKELILLPNQTCPQHKHPPVKGLPGVSIFFFFADWGLLCPPAFCLLYNKASVLYVLVV